MTVGEALAHARALGVERLDAQLLLAHCLGVTRAWLLAHDDAALSEAHAAASATAFTRRADDVPLAYLTGTREFHGLPLAVTPDVLDPRPDTETLVDWAIERLDARPARAIDLGTGSGAIALAVKQARPGVQMHATDLSDKALEVARANSRRLGLHILFAHGDWWAATPGLRFALALSNPPYIAAADPHLGALRHEPKQALTPGPGGLEAIERIVQGAPAHLEPDGWLLLEHGFEQADDVSALLERNGFLDIQTRTDLAGRPRCTGGRRP